MERKMKATLIFPFLYLISPLIVLATGKDMQTVNERIWFGLNGVYDDEE